MPPILDCVSLSQMDTEDSDSEEPEPCLVRWHSVSSNPCSEVTPYSEGQKEVLLFSRGVIC